MTPELPDLPSSSFSNGELFSTVLLYTPLSFGDKRVLGARGAPA